ncbi:MAG: metallophosphoesterase [Oscillospiraceae bacterium]|jgi:predicted MPP superfamily phosphohydrolase|nr:metallophosphoesterase [Oscillospiraceae bacterium]
MKKLKFRKKYFFLAGGGILAGVFLLIVKGQSLTVTSYTIETEKLENPVRIAHITDLHSNFYGKNQKKLILRIDEQNPDIIVMTGDIADDRVKHDGTIKLLEGIADRYPCFYVSGNHEMRSGEFDSIKEIFLEYGVVVLEGENTVTEINGQFINICGIDDPGIGKKKLEKQIESAFADIDESLYTILLFHRPEHFPKMAENHFDLMLTGHAHGGQWRIPYILEGVYSPNQGLFPKYTNGIYTLNDRTMLVSRGLGRMSPPVRFFNPPELVIIDILPK